MYVAYVREHPPTRRRRTTNWLVFQLACILLNSHQRWNRIDEEEHEKGYVDLLSSFAQWLCVCHSEIANNIDDKSFFAHFIMTSKFSFDLFCLYPFLEFARCVVATYGRIHNCTNSRQTYVSSVVRSLSLYISLCVKQFVNLSFSCSQMFNFETQVTLDYSAPLKSLYSW